MKHSLPQQLVGSLLAALAEGGCSQVEPAPAQTFEGAARVAAGANETAEAEAVITVDGMVYQGCANATAEAASQVPGCVSQPIGGGV